MGWFDDQIRERMRGDQEVFEDSFVRIAGAVLGGQEAQRLRDERTFESKDALFEQIARDAETAKKVCEERKKSVYNSESLC